MLINLLGIFFSIKIFFVAVKWAQKIGVCVLPVLLIFTQGPSKSELLSKSIPEQVYHNVVGTMRQDSRLILGRIIPLKSSYFKNLNEEDLLMLPKPEDALIQFNKSTNSGIEKISRSVPVLQGQIKLITLATWKLFTEEPQTKRDLASIP